MSKAEHQLIQEEIEAHRTGNRTESAALLAWFLAAVWRIEPEDIDDAICDGTGDKGIDGLLVDDDLAEITILQSKHKVKHNGQQGDKDLRDLVGAAAYFDSPESVDTLLASNANVELKQLLQRLEIRERVAQGAHAKRLVFVTDGTLNVDGTTYVEAIAGHDPPLEVWDQPRLSAVAQRTKSPELLPFEVSLEAVADPTVVRHDGTPRLAVGVVPAWQLISLPGIEDLTLFDRNVRLSEGRTRINRELGQTIRDPAEHALFPAYHNGITVLTHELKVDGPTITLGGITVVNGCQSLLTLHDHHDVITDQLQVLVKIVAVEPHSDVADRITYRSNNQNPVDLRDQRSTDVIQRALQAEVDEKFDGRLGYGIRQGEELDADEVLDNKTAAQFLMAVYLAEPWNAVRKVRLFDHDYRRIFNREVDADRLFFLHHFSKVVDATRDHLRGDVAASFASVRLTIAYLIAQVLMLSDEGRELLAAPGRWLPDKLDEVLGALSTIAEDVVASVNFYIEAEKDEKGDEFDPKVAFKSTAGVKGMTAEVLKSSKRQAKRDEEFLFQVPPSQ